ncbi:MAG: energy transducer TonB [Acidobacteriota bacterium]
MLRKIKHCSTGIGSLDFRIGQFICLIIAFALLPSATLAALLWQESSALTLVFPNIDKEFHLALPSAAERVEVRELAKSKYFLLKNFVPNDMKVRIAYQLDLSGDGKDDVIVITEKSANASNPQVKSDGFILLNIDGQRSEIKKLPIVRASEESDFGYQSGEYIAYKAAGSTFFATTYYRSAQPVIALIYQKAPESFLKDDKLIEETSSDTAESEAQEPAPVRHSEGVIRGDAIERAAPDYPPIARNAGIEGDVEVEVTINEEGEVINTRIVSGHHLLHVAALSAAQKWKFKPTVLNRRPVKVVGVLTFRFKL